MTAVKGGAISTYNTIMSIKNCTFIECKASHSGGSLSMNALDHSKHCEIANSTFIRNHADIQGGAFHYTHHQPVGTNLEFINNTAGSKYGSNISSFPFYLDFLNEDDRWTNKTVIRSGVTLTKPLLLALFDREK